MISSCCWNSYFCDDLRRETTRNTHSSTRGDYYSCHANGENDNCQHAQRRELYNSFLISLCVSLSENDTRSNCQHAQRIEQYDSFPISLRVSMSKRFTAKARLIGWTNSRTSAASGSTCSPQQANAWARTLSFRHYFGL